MLGSNDLVACELQIDEAMNMYAANVEKIVEL